MTPPNFAIGRAEAYEPHPENITIMQLVATADVDIVYGPLRLAVAEWAGKDPADVTGQDVAAYEMEQEGAQ